MRPLVTFGLQDVIFEHYRVREPAVIARQLPGPLVLDRFEGAPYVSVVSLKVAGQKLGGRWATPGARDYLRINVRTYVRHRGHAGVWCLHNVVDNRAATLAGRLMGLPERHGRIEHRQRFEYATADHRIAGRPGAEVGDEPRARFLADRFFQWSKVAGAIVEVELDQGPWPLVRLAVHQRDHGLIHALGLWEAVEPVLDVHAAVSVQGAMAAPRLLHEPVPRRAPVPLQ